ncbi:MAG: hypothetical protein V7606_2950 [Burkholderiales bacterium]|jgi:hypothetical protein|nr:hypothetical protein [Burkholderia sp.]
MKKHFVLAMLLGDLYALICIYLLVAVFSGAELPHFPFTPFRN